MKIETFDINGKGKSIEIAEKIFSAKVNEKLISHAFYSNNANAKLSQDLKQAKKNCRFQKEHSCKRELR